MTSDLVDLISNSDTYSDTVANETVQALCTTCKRKATEVSPNRVCDVCLLRLSHAAYYKKGLKEFLKKSVSSLYSVSQKKGCHPIHGYNFVNS